MDFKEVRAAVPIEKAATFLGIELKKEKDHYRCYCPACDKQRVLIITPSKGVFYCHNMGRGGDVSDLAAHVKGITQVQALKLLADAFLREPVKPKPPARRKRANSKEKGSKLSPPTDHGAGGTEEAEQWEAFISRL